MRDNTYPRKVIVRLRNDEDIRKFGEKIGRKNITIKTKRIAYSNKKLSSLADFF